MTIPTGTPLWARGRVPSAYGGNPGLRDYGGIGAVDAQTDITAAQYLRLSADVAAIANTSAICTLLFTWSTSDPLVTFVNCGWADPITVSYSGATPPSSLYPSVVKDSASRCVVTLPATAPDQFGVTGAITARAVIVTLGLSSVTGVYWEGPTGGNSLAIAGLPTASLGVQLVIW